MLRVVSSLPLLPSHLVGPLCAHAKATDIVADLVPGERRMHTCNYLDTLSPRRNYVIPGNRGHRSESQVVYLSPSRARKVLSLIVTFFNYSKGDLSVTEKIVEKKRKMDPFTKIRFQRKVFFVETFLICIMRNVHFIIVYAFTPIKYVKCAVIMYTRLLPSTALKFHLPR
ncbi:hypothetical protein PUN28_006802 [Cardiocondyla obscurior]|uniref:Secreted protein n=1 Tax=Cardiocondyla obscurior TaxID=286306 RepID=A0AAW2G4T8_9HYME